MHMRVGVVGLVRILAREVGVHQVRHRAPVDQEVGGMVRLGLYVETASLCAGRAASQCRDLCQRLPVNSGVHLGPLEQVFAVVAAPGMVVGRMRQPKIDLAMSPLRSRVQGVVAAVAVGRDGRWKDDDGPVQAHLDLEVALRPAVIRVRSRRGGSEGVSYAAAVNRLARQQPLLRSAGSGGRWTTAGYIEARKQNRGIAGGGGQV